MDDPSRTDNSPTAALNLEKIRSDSDGSMSGMVTGLFNQVAQGNPYFAAGGGS